MSFLAADIGSSTIFVLISDSLHIQAMLILILSDVQYSQKAVFNFEKCSNHQNHSSGSLQPVKKILSPSKITDPPPPSAWGFTPPTTPYIYLKTCGICKLTWN